MALFSPRWKHSRRIEYSGCDQEVYQQDLVIHRTAGRDYEEAVGPLRIWHIYVGDHCREDYGDIRFTNSTGAELAYYLWPGYDAESARFTVRLEGATTAGTLAIHYGNPAAATTSNRDAVIPIYFDFDDGSLTGWVRQNQYSSPRFTLIDSAGRGKVLKAGPTSLTAGLYYRELEYSGGGLLCFSANCPTVGIGHDQEGMEAIAVATYQGETLLMTHVAAFSNKVQDNSAAGTLYIPFNTFKYAPDSEHTFIHLNSLGFGNWVTHSIPFSDNGTNKIRIIFKHCDGSGNGANAYWDDIYIRAYSATPPSLLRTSRGIIAPPPGAITVGGVPVDLEVLYDIEIGSTGKNLALLYHLLRARDITTPYHILRAQAIDAIYQIEVLKDLLTTYHILIKQETILPYDIPGGVTFQLVYSVLAEAVLDYQINVGDQVYDPERFWDLIITRKLNQVHTATFELWTEGTDVSGVREGATLRIFYNDEVRFSGEIRSIRKDDMSGIWSVECESGACRLADDAVQGVLDYKATAGDQILRAVLPSAAWEGEIDPAPAIDYRQEYADVLTHVTNLASVLGYDWRVREVEDRYQVTGRTETSITVAGAGWPTSSLVGRVVVVTSGTAKFRAGIVASHTTDTLTFAGTTWTTDGLKPGDAIRVFGPFRLDCKKRIGATVPRKTFMVNREIFDSSTSRDLERVANAIVVPGTASITQDRNSGISGNTLLVTPIAVTEAILRLNLSSSATVVPVDSTAGFPPSGTIQIESEKIAYTEKAATSFTGCTRGYGGTQPAAHNLQTEVVLVSSLPVESTAGFPPSGTIWVGIEKIGYAAKAAKAFLNLTRGVDGTEIYAHRAGVLARCGSYTDESPEPGSSVALYGVRRRVVPALGVLDQNTLDLLAQERLLALQDLKVWGSGIVIDSAFLEDIDVGDEIAIAPEDGGDAESYRLVGVVWRQMTGEIEIEYGAVREYFLEDLSRLQKGVDLANARGAVAMLGTVLSVSSNGEVAQVLLDDGTTVWARIR